jgi:hypothetical protein
MKNDKTQQLMMEELEETTNPVHKFALLQKYGIVEPKLTRAEQKLIKTEQRSEYGR